MIFYPNFCKVQRLQSYRPLKLVTKKNSRPFGFEATFFAILLSKSLLFGRPGFDPRTAQTLKVYSFVAPWYAGIKISFLGRSDLFLSAKIKKMSMAMHLGHIMPNWSTPISYHKSAIVREWGHLTVYTQQPILHSIISWFSFSLATWRTAIK